MLVRLKVECLDFCGIAIHHDRPVEIFCQKRFVRISKIPAPLDFAALRLQNLDRLVVAHAREWHLDVAEFRSVALKYLQFFAPVVEHSCRYINDQFFGNALDLFEVGVSHLGFTHPKFSQMPARLRLFRAESWSKTVDLTESHC